MSDGPAPVGLLHPGEMGAAVGAELRSAGHRVLWVSAGRSTASAARAAAAGLEPVGELAELLGSCETVLSVCPPGAAPEVAAAVAGRGFDGVYADCNAVSPRSAAELMAVLERGGARCADGGIVGPPPGPDSGPRLYLSGSGAAGVAGLFAGTRVEARVLDGDATAASALKMLYAAWTKGSAALLLAIAAAADRAGLAPELEAEWAHSLPGLAERLQRARGDREAKGWRWVAEMEEVARTCAELGAPPGFHEAAAEVFAAPGAEPGN